jgi:hypothetical protein
MQVTVIGEVVRQHLVTPGVQFSRPQVIWASTAPSAPSAPASGGGSTCSVKWH